MTQRPNPLNAYLGHLGTATIEWIGVRPRRREPLMAVTEAEAVADLGLRGEAELGPGGVVAMMGYGGLCAKVLQTGQIAIGDSLRLAAS